MIPTWRMLVRGMMPVLFAIPARRDFAVHQT